MKNTFKGNEILFYIFLVEFLKQSDPKITAVYTFISSKLQSPVFLLMSKGGIPDRNAKHENEKRTS